MDLDKLHAVTNLRSIKGTPYPADVGFRQIVITGPPGCGKSSRVEKLGGWPGEAFLDLTRAGWWRDRALATRPREVHLGLPIAGHAEGLALFEHASEDTRELIFEPQRLRVPARHGSYSLDWHRRFVLEFLLPPAEQVLEVRQARAVGGTHPVDRTIYLEQIRFQLEAYFRVAEILHQAGFRVLVRRDFEATPFVFREAASSPSTDRPRRSAARTSWASALFGRFLSRRPERAIREMDRIRLEGEALLFGAGLLPLEVRQGGTRLRLDRDRLIFPGKKPLDTLVLTVVLGEDPAIVGFASLEVDEFVRLTHGDKVIKDSLPLPAGSDVRLQIENAHDGIVVTDLHSEGGTEVVALSREAANADAVHAHNLERVDRVLGRPIELRAAEAAHATLRAVNDRLVQGTWRPVADDGVPGALLEIPADLVPVIVGDLHANVDNLLKILCVNHFLEQVEAGRAVLIFLGDAVHPEEEHHLGDMESSLLMMDLILRLMEAFPDRVVYVRGNHDSFSSEVAKEGVPQGRLWRDFIDSTRGGAYLQDFKCFYSLCPLIATGEDFVACHAGPPKGSVSRDRLINAAKDRRLVHELTWNRFKGPGNPGGYGKPHVKALRAALGLSPKATMVVSHNPLRDGQSVWLNAAGIKRHHVVYCAGREEFTVFTRLGDRLRPLVYRAEPLLRHLAVR